jgi:hypothetical protein
MDHMEIVSCVIEYQSFSKLSVTITGITKSLCTGLKNMNRNTYIWHIYTYSMVLEYGIQHLPLSKITVSHVGFFMYQHHGKRIWDTVEPIIQLSLVGNPLKHPQPEGFWFWMTCSVYGIAAGKLVLSLVNFVVLMRGNMSPNRKIAKIH